MARKRVIDPEFWFDTEIGKGSDKTQLLYIGLWNYAEDTGVVQNDLDFLKAKIFPYKEADVQKCLDELISLNKLIILHYKDREYLFIVNFHKHQKISHPSIYKFPLPPEPFLQFIPDKILELVPAEHRIYGELATDDPPEDKRKTPEDSRDNSEDENKTPESSENLLPNVIKSNIKEVNNNPSDITENPISDPTKTPSTPKHEQLANHLKYLMLENNPKVKLPTNMNKWNKDMELLLRVDKRDFDEAWEILEWCQQDPFWMTNILSAGKFKKQYDQLKMKMERDWKWQNKQKENRTVEYKDGEVKL